MNNHKKNPPPELPSEREILRGRKSQPTDALAREAGDMLKGASPVAAHDQTIFAVKELLRTFLPDADGSLRHTILARLETDYPLVASYFGAPGKLLLAWADRVSASDAQLAELVRETDSRWGREYAERPRFEREGSAPDPDDPYTEEGVRAALEHLRRALQASG